MTDLSDPDRHWWAFGEYIGNERQPCPNCRRSRLMLAKDIAGEDRIICEKCAWEPAKNAYCDEAIGS